VKISVNSCCAVRAGRLFLTADGQSNLNALDPTTGKLVWRLAAGFITALAPWRDHVLAATRAGIVEVDPSQGKIVRTISVPGGACRLSVNRDSAVVTHSPSKPGWYTVDLKTGAVTVRDDAFVCQPVVGVMGDDAYLIGRTTSSLDEPHELAAFSLNAIR